MKKGDYMYNTDEDNEATRLRLFNEAYNPITQKILSSLIRPDMSILELGIGIGITGAWFISQLGPSGKYVGIDKDPVQMQRAGQLIATNNNIILIAEDASRFSETTRKIVVEGFDLIYCHWLLCNLIEKNRLDVIKSACASLKVNGSFICQEPDLTGTHLKFKGEKIESSAIQKLKDATIALQDNAGLNAQLNETTLRQLFGKVDLDWKCYKVEIIGSFQPELSGGQKNAIPLSIQAGKKFASHFIGQTEEELDNLIGEFEVIANNPDYSIAFYTDTLAKITRIL